MSMPPWLRGVLTVVAWMGVAVVATAICTVATMVDDFRAVGWEFALFMFGIPLTVGPAWTATYIVGDLARAPGARITHKRPYGASR